jgi:hypothetical protein
MSFENTLDFGDSVDWFPELDIRVEARGGIAGALSVSGLLFSLLSK